MAQLSEAQLLNFAYTNSNPDSGSEMKKSVILAYCCHGANSSQIPLMTFGLRAQGINIIDIGITSVEELTFAVREFQAGAGIRIEQSPGGDMYCRVIDANANETDSQLALESKGQVPGVISSYGHVQKESLDSLYVMNLISVMHCLSKQPLNEIRPLKIALHHSSCETWPILSTLQNALRQRRIPLNLFNLSFQPKAQFGHDVAKHRADFGVIISPQSSHCQIVDESGEPVAMDKISDALSSLFDAKYPTDGSANAGDIKTAPETDSTCNLVEQMRLTNANYASDEKYHYFRHLAFAKSALLPWLLLAIKLHQQNCPLSALSTTNTAIV